MEHFFPPQCRGFTTSISFDLAKTSHSCALLAALTGFSKDNCKTLYLVGAVYRSAGSALVRGIFIGHPEFAVRRSLPRVMRGLPPPPKFPDDAKAPEPNGTSRCAFYHRRGGWCVYVCVCDS